MLGGIQVNEPDMNHWLDVLKEEGFNTVSLTVYARHQRWDGSEIEERAEAEWVIPEIRAAKERGLRVALILRVALEHALDENRFLWHGMIMPRTEEDLARWFERYGSFVRQWAEIAEAEGVDLLGIGSELNALASTRPVDEIPELEEYYMNEEKQARERQRTLSGADGLEQGSLDGQLKAGWGEEYDDLGRFLDDRTRAHAFWARQVTGDGDVAWINQRRGQLTEHWRTLISSVRVVYSGNLSYAANFDQYGMVAFWDRLDVIGINAYFPLRADLEVQDHSTLLEEFRSAWQLHLSEIEELRREVGAADLPVVFTELGYTRRRGGTLEPWAGDGFGVVGEESDAEMLVWRNRPSDQRERALAVRALREAAAEYPDLLRGVLYWKLSTQPEHQEIEPFVLILGTGDPLEDELVALRENR